MMASGRTALEQLGLRGELLTLLRSLSFDSAEEAIAYIASLKRSNPDVAHRFGLSSLFDGNTAGLAPYTQLSFLQDTSPGGSFGCIVDEALMQDYFQRGSFRTSGARPSGIFNDSLPNSIRLMDRMPQVRNQGARGTCVAFGATALREFLAKDRTDLSEQFLYWGCKELDGIPGQEGTYLHTAMTALSQYGICEEPDWLYNPMPGSGEGQGPPPDGCLEKALEYRLESVKPVEPGLVAQYKSVLAGSSRKVGAPVVFATLVFAWANSAFTNITGKIPMPFPDEKPLGGHAWCVVGYVDDDHYPGGGYFIVRNSWGEQWAYDSPEAKGHAMLPYAYVENYTYEAFTGPSEGSETAATGKVEGIAKYTRTLDIDSAEELDGVANRGRKLLSGTYVIFDRFKSDVFREATEKNKALFKERNFTWTHESWQKSWFIARDAVNKEELDYFEKAIIVRRRFSDAIYENISSSKGQIYPNLRTPLWHDLIPFYWEQRIDTAKEILDISEEAVCIIERNSGLPDGLRLPEQWLSALRLLNKVQIFQIGHGSNLIHVISAFITPMHFANEGYPELLPMTQAVANEIEKAYEACIREKKITRPTMAFFTYGSMASNLANEQAQDVGNHWMLFSKPSEEKGWITSKPRYGWSRPVCDFIDRLKPETANERITKIRNAVDMSIDEGGNVTVERIKEKTEYRKSLICAAFFAIQDRSSDDYRLYMVKTSRLPAIERARLGSKITIKSKDDKRNVVRTNILRLTAAGVSVGATQISASIRKEGIAGFAVSIVFIYLVGCIQKAINRRADDSKE